MASAEQHRFAVIGDRVIHSLSPLIHNASARNLHADFSYSAHALDEADFDAFMQSFKAGETQFSGLNVTVPYKERVLEYCDELSPRARELGSVNTLTYFEGRVIGDNSDWQGFCSSLKSLLDFLPPSELLRDAAIIGTGGVARTVIHALAHFGFKKVHVQSRNLKRAQNFCEAWAHLGIELVASEKIPGLERYALIVNTTPLGFRDEDPLPISEELLRRSDAYFDLVYRSGRGDTASVALARELGIHALGGAQMLVAQAVEAELIWSKYFKLFEANENLSLEKLGAKINLIMQEALSRANDKRHISFIGFMGSGKTTLSRMFAQEYHFDFVDLDAEISDRLGMSTSEIFEKLGEDDFRKTEHEILAEFLDRTRPCIISCGGGVTTNPANVELLSFKSKVVYLEMDIKKLHKRLKKSHAKYPKKRPLLSQGLDFASIEKRFKSREKSYLSTADFVVNLDKSATREQGLALVTAELQFRKRG